MIKRYIHVDSKLKIPMFIKRGNSKKTCFISGGMHGDEINGIRLVQMVMQNIQRRKIDGTIIFIPIINISGFRNKQRYAEDGLDINRCFFQKGRSTSFRIAKAMTGMLQKCDLGIDCHDSGNKDVLLPHTRVHIDKRRVCIDGCTVNYGKIFGSKIILERKGSKGMMATETFNHLKKPVLTVEIGGGMVLWERFLQQGLNGIKNILIHEEMIQGKIKSPKDQFLIEDENRYSYKSENEGLLYKKIRLGSHVHKGDLIAEIQDPLDGSKKRIKSNHCGFVFSIKMQEKINEEEGICSILAEKVCQIHHTKPDDDLIKV